MGKKLLVVVDMQNDFITGSLGTAEAQKIVPNVVAKIKEWDGDIICTMDTHGPDYLETLEGKELPVEHCIAGTFGHDIDINVGVALRNREKDGADVQYLQKHTFGSTALPELIRFKDYDEIDLVGLCTDICVISNALILRANYPNTPIIVDEMCCAGTSPEAHDQACNTMISCQIFI